MKVMQISSSARLQTTEIWNHKQKERKGRGGRDRGKAGCMHCGTDINLDGGGGRTVI